MGILAFISAVRWGFTQMVKLLIEAGVDLNIINHEEIKKLINQASIVGKNNEIAIAWAFFISIFKEILK